MNIQLRRFLLVGSILYLIFLGWFFFVFQSGMKNNWRPSDIYNQVGDCPVASGHSPAPKADAVFEAKLDAPIKSVSSSKRSFRKRRSAMPVAKSSLGQGKSALYKFSVTPVGGGLHLVSDAEFRSFGAEGLMYVPIPQYLKRRVDGRSSTSTPFFYPYMSVPNNGSEYSDVEAAQSASSSLLLN